MPQMFLAPTGPIDHVNTSLLNPISNDKFKHFLNPEEYQELINKYPKEEYRTWGWEPSQKKLWEKLKFGDYVFFVSGEGHVFIVKVVHIFHNEKFALDCWGTHNRTGNTWEYMFVLEDNLAVLNVEKSEFVQVFGYKPNYKIQGAIQITPEHISKMISSYGGVSGLINHFSDFTDTAKSYGEIVEDKKIKDVLEDISTEEKVKVLREKLSEESTVTYVEHKGKRIKRNLWLAELVKAKNDYKCQVCGFTFIKKDGSKYVEAIHMKPLASSKMDTEDNMLALCPNHHKVFDKGTKEDRDEILRKCGKT